MGVPTVQRVHSAAPGGVERRRRDVWRSMNKQMHFIFKRWPKQVLFIHSVHSTLRGWRFNLPTLATMLPTDLNQSQAAAHVSLRSCVPA